MYKYKCWNPKCPYFAGYNYIIKTRKPLTICPYCRKRSLESLSGEPPKGARPVAGAAGGALLGWAIGGPPGAIIGGLIGLLLGTTIEEKEQG